MFFLWLINFSLFPGKYCYKPTMKETCCPQYEIKCDVNQIKLSKSQKKVIRRMKNFLLSEGCDKHLKKNFKSILIEKFL